MRSTVGRWVFLSNANMLDKISYVGQDLNPASIASGMPRERLQTAGVRDVEIVQGDGQQMPLPSGSFDLVFLVDVVGETPDKPVFFRECARVLKPGAILAVTEELNDPNFRLPSTGRTLATDAG